MPNPLEDTADSDLATEVLRQLFALRSAKGRLTPQKLGRYPALVQVMGGGDLLDAFMAFRRELNRYVETANRNEAAAALSISAEDEHVGQRLQYCANRLSDGGPAEQRTARHWSDAGMPVLAQDLVYMAAIQKRLGREVLGLELSGAQDSGVGLIIDQIASADLDLRAPEVSIWRFDPSGDPMEITVDLDSFALSETTYDGLTMQRHRLLVELPPALYREPGKVLSLTVTGRDAPIRTIFFEDNSSLSPQNLVRFSCYRSIATVEICN